ncbi:MAG: MBOAT family protein [Firmicutes bacterium]|nr:MBOAT family protein [Bacillota bacterium]
MSFSDPKFIIVFMPVFVAVYVNLSTRSRKYWLCAASIGFYLLCIIEQPWSAFLLLLSALFNYIIAMALEESPNRGLVFLAGVAWNVITLLTFKYTALFIGSLPFIPAVLGIDPGKYQVDLPIGISFYTFTFISYVVDVYKGRIKAETDPISFLAYVMYFPKFMSGPITRYGDLGPQIKDSEPAMGPLLEGLKLFVFGLTFKVFLAHQLGNLFSDVKTIGYDSVSTALAWMGVIGYSLQLYLDFWGYSLMAMGIAKMIGMELPENFRAPYASVSMTEFWRRWHITLGSWFRDYVYIPLGGSKKGLSRTVINLFVVWLLTGMWHGASWNFLIWGILLFAVMTVEKLGLKDFLDKHRVVGHIYMALLIPLSWTVFAIERSKDLMTCLSRLFGGTSVNVMEGDWLKYGKTYWWILLIGIALSTELPFKVYEKWGSRKWFWLVCAGCAALSGYCIYKGSNDPFMYFRF